MIINFCQTVLEIFVGKALQSVFMAQLVMRQAGLVTHYALNHL